MTHDRFAGVCLAVDSSCSFGLVAPGLRRRVLRKGSLHDSLKANEFARLQSRKHRRSQNHGAQVASQVSLPPTNLEVERNRPFAKDYVQTHLELLGFPLGAW